jgi:small conductance mechanosensitive channel
LTAIPAFATTLETRLLLLAAISVGGAAVLVFATRRGLARSALAPRLKRSIFLIVSGPIVAAILGGAVVEMAYLSTAFLPPELGAPEIALIVELVVTAVVIRTLGAIAKHVMTHVTGREGMEREIVYGIYGLGVVAIAFTLLTFPGSPKVVGTVWQAVGFLAGLTITYLITYVVNAATGRYSQILYSRDPQFRTTAIFARRLLIGIIALIGVAATTFAVFPTAGAAVASIFVAAGFASIVIGLAAQSSLANIFAGMVVSTSQPFRIGDAVLFQMPWGPEWCWVEDVKLTFTVLKTWDKRRLVVPNQTFLSQALVNYDLNDSSKLCIVFVTVSYESDVDKAIEIMKGAARGHPDFLPEGNLPVVHLMDMGDANGTSPSADVAAGITLRLLSNAKDQPTNFQMSKDLLYTIRKEFQKNGIRIAYPRREVLLREERGPDSRKGRDEETSR